MANPIIYLTKKWWTFSKGNRKNVALYTSLFFIAQMFSFFEPLIIGLLLNTIQEQGLSNISFVLGIALLYVVLRLGFWIFHGPARVIEISNAFYVRAKYKEHLVDGVLHLPPKWHTDHHSGDSIDKIEKGTTALFSFSNITFEIIDTVMRFIGSYIALVYFNFHSSYIILFFVIITILTILQFDKRIIPNYREINKMENTIASKIFDTISNVTTVIILRIEKLVATDIYKAIQKPFTIFRRNAIINEAKWFSVSMLTALMVFFVIGSYLFQAYLNNDALMLGTIYILYGYVERINNLFYRFAFRYGEIIKEYAAVNNAEILEKDFLKKKKIKKAFFPKQWNVMQIHNLSFSYDGEKSSSLHLNNVSLTFKRGERIAFIGESGSGKTTMLKVIRGLYQSPAYQLSIDGTYIKHGFKAIKDDIALIPQDPEIFNATIKENITFGIRHTMPTIIKCTDMAKFTHIVHKLPNKWNSSIVEKGVNLSGGEKQRLALARGLLACQDKPFILLDEPTSSVDPKNELAIYKNVFREFKSKTIISTIHRLHLLPLFDTIYIFQNGEIVAVGSYHELQKTSHIFRRMLQKYAKTQEME